MFYCFDYDKMRRSILPVLLAVAVVLAGCSGFPFGGDETPTRTVTPAAVPTDEPTPTPVPQLAPGLTGQGVTDAFVLGEAHVAALDDISYTMQENFSVTYRNRTDYRQRGVVARLAANDSRYYVSRSISGPQIYGNGTAVNAFWSNGTRVLRAQMFNGSVSYYPPRGADRGTRSPARVGFATTNREQIYRLFSSVETRVTDRERRNGTTVYRVEATNVTNPTAFEGIKRQNPENLTLVAHINSAGLIREYRLNYTATVNGSPVRVSRRARYTNLGNTTVERPPWYDEAIANVSTATPAG
jgi:hypothetical protein